MCKTILIKYYTIKIINNYITIKIKKIYIKDNSQDKAINN